MTLKIKDKKIIMTKLLFRQLYITRKFELQGSFCALKDPDPDPVFSRIRIRVTQKTGSATLVFVSLFLYITF